MIGTPGTLSANCPYIELLNTHNILRFQGSTAITFLGAVTPLPFFQNLNTQFWAQSFTAFGIMRQDGAPSVSNTFHCFKPNTLSIMLLATTGAGFDVLRLSVLTSNNQFVVVDAGIILNQGWKVVCWQWDHTNKRAKIVINGTVFSSVNVAMNTFDFRIPTSSYTVGQRQTEAGTIISPLTGKLGEFFYYNDVKSNADINSCGNYLADKYGLTWTNI
jgi:hypothetical protein